MDICTEKNLPVDYLRKLLDYDALTGVVKWKPRALEHFKSERDSKIWNTRYAGTVVGVQNSRGYLVFKLNKRCYRLHRVVWAIHYNEHPEIFIDHINGDKRDNRISNLRLVDAEGNARNRKTPSSNSSGIIGVRWDKRYGTWKSTIGDEGEDVSLGSFDNLLDAAAARKSAEVRFGYHRNHGR